MNFKKLEAQFKAFIETELKGSKAHKHKKLTDEDTSIFANHESVNKFIQKQYGFDADDMTMNLKTLFNMDIKGGQFVDTGEYDLVDDIELEEDNDLLSLLDGDKDDEDGGLSKAAQKNIGSSMVEVINDMLDDEDMQDVIDKDGNGKISKKEIQSFLKSAAGIDGNEKDISLEDILSAVDAVKNADEAEEDEDIDEDIDEDYDDEDVNIPAGGEDVAPAQNAGGASGGGGVSGGGGGGRVGGSSGGGASPTVSNSANPNAAKTIDNMNADELKAELETKKSELSEKQKALDEASSGSSPKLQDLKTKVDEAYDKYQEAVKEVDEELAEKLDEKKQAVDEKKQEISEKEAEITENEGKVSEAETAVSNAESKISSLESAISSIAGSLSGDLSDEQKASLESKKSELESQLKEAQNEKKEAENNLEEAKEALEKSKEDKEALEGELETAEQELQDVEQEIHEKAPELDEYKQAYEDAQKELDTAKTEEVSKAQEAVKVAQDEVNEIQTKLTEVQNKAIEASAKLTALTGSYNYNGENYNTVLDQAELDKLVQEAAAGGAGTKFGKADKCLSIAETYGAWMTGDSNTSCAMSGTYQDATKYSVFNTENKDELLATVKEELDAGRPCVLHVNGAGTGRHYVTVVGYKSSAGNTIDESDLLIWDSYACTIGSCPNDRHMITGWSTGRTGNEGYGWQVYKRKT